MSAGRDDFFLPVVRRQAGVTVIPVAPVGRVHHFGGAQ